MTALPAASDFTGSTVTEGQFKTALTALRDYLSGLLGSDGLTATALGTLGALGSGYELRSAASSITVADRGKVIAASVSTTWTLSLLAAATAGAGFSFILRNVGTTSLTIDPSGSETIDGATTLALSAGRGAIVICTGTGWVTQVLPGAVATGILSIGGTAAGPGFSFGVDQDLGLYRAAADQLGFAAAGVARALLGTTAFQIDVPVTGTAAQSGVNDATAGRLLKVGAGGLLSAGNSVALSGAILSGFYSYASGDAQAPQAGVAGAVLVAALSATVAWQVAVSGGLIFRRSTSTGGSSWTAWVADAEFGTNANGDYLRLPDGTQVCWRRNWAPAAGGDTWTFPAAFIAQSTTSVWGTSSSTAASRTVGAIAISATQATVRAFDSVGSGVSSGVHTLAVGRWY